MKQRDTRTLACQEGRLALMVVGTSCSRPKQQVRLLANAAVCSALLLGGFAGAVIALLERRTTAAGKKGRDVGSSMQNVLACSC